MKTLTPEDLAALQSADADPLAKDQVLRRLAHWERGKFDHLESAISQHLHHPVSLVRGQAFITLVGAWLRPKYIAEAIAALRHIDEDSYADREMIAYALGQYAAQASPPPTEIMHALAVCVRDDPEWPVQKAAYDAVLTVVAPDRRPEVSGDKSFHAAGDVDWSLLRPYLTPQTIKT